MRTAIAETSLSAFHSFKPVELQRKEQEVLDLINQMQFSITREEIARLLGWKESAVCGRVNSLVTKGLLIEEEGGKTRSGRSAKLVSLRTWSVPVQCELPL